jgi:phage shock protein PspC (stress-responsive transcriptional regulator)
MTIMAVLKQFTSRKFLLALVGVASGLAMAFGVDGSEIMEVVSAVGGVVTALGSIIAYAAAESRVDAAAVGVNADGNKESN